VPKISRIGRTWGVGAVVAGASLVAVGLVLSVLLSAAPPTFTGLAPAQILARAQSASERVGSVHVVVHVTDGSQTETLTDDTTRTTGYQMITAGAELAQIVVVDRMAYIRGNSTALSRYFNLPGPVASRLAGRWVSFRPSNIGYADVTVGVTLDSTLQALDPKGELRRDTPTRLGGVRVIGVTGSSSAEKATVYVDLTGRHLPWGAVQTSGTGGGRTTASIRLSGWGQRIMISAPPDAIPISSFTSSAPAPATPGS
jgi:hypothetical protein